MSMILHSSILTAIFFVNLGNSALFAASTKCQVIIICDNSQVTFKYLTDFPVTMFNIDGYHNATFQEVVYHNIPPNDSSYCIDFIISVKDNSVERVINLVIKDNLFNFANKVIIYNSDSRQNVMESYLTNIYYGNFRWLSSINGSHVK